MNTDQIITSVSIFALVVSFAGFNASAERIMYHGFPLDKDAAYCKGFVSSGADAFRPTKVGNMIKTGSAQTSLLLPGCFAESTKILQQKGGADDAAVFIADESGGLFSGTASGGKVCKMTDNCQARKGTLYFRLLLNAEQGVIDALEAKSNVYPTVANSQSCGILWTVPDYHAGCVGRDNLRLNQGLALSVQDNIADSSINLNFVRGFLVSLFKDSTGAVSIKLFAWGSDTAELKSARTCTLVDNVQAGATYICLLRIDVGAGDEADVIYAMAQPTSTYDPKANWPGKPFPTKVTANLIGGEDVSSLNANLVLYGANKNSGKMRFDEICLSTSADEAVVSDVLGQNLGHVIAYDGFPCGMGAYANDSLMVRKMSALSTVDIYGFSDTKWNQKTSKDAPTLFGAGTGLLLPELYAANGISATDGTAIGFSSSSVQSLLTYREFSNGLLNLSVGKTLNMRFLLSVTKDALSSLVVGPDTAGTLIEGESGVKAHVNYLGAGIDTLTTGAESGDSAAPALCKRDNSCLFTFVKGSDGTVGLYLNLRTHAADTPSAYKLASVDASVGGTFLCFASIEVGTGTGGKERIRAFGVNVNEVSEQHIETWAPANAGKESAIEYEIIGSEAYPKHLVVGGDACKNKFAFDEFALSLGDWYPLVWAKYPRKGLMLSIR